MKIELIVALILGCVFMIAIISIQLKWYRISIWKSVPISVILVFVGIYGSQIWFYIENGFFGGRSLYGAIALAPIVFFPVSKLLKISYLESLDFCATAGSLTLGLTKIQCLYDGCCPGMILYVDQNYQYVRFPSQLIEFVVFIMISCVLLIMSYRVKYRKTIFFWFLIIYGTSRFILNFFRDNNSAYALGLSAGSFWSMCSLLIGIIALIILYKSQRHRGNS